MIIKGCKLTNFRSHEFFELKCWKETTMISGENGGGKTSILEAIYEALRGKSFRAVDREILRRGAEFYRVELDYVNGEKVVFLETRIEENHSREGLNLCFSELFLSMERVRHNMVGLLYQP